MPRRYEAWFGYNPSLRIGDAERNEVTDALGRHFSEGRLDESELKERLERATAAKTGADLTGLLSDLPPLGPPGDAAPPAPVHRPSHRGLWIALAVILLALWVPWTLVPWAWFPHPPWFLVAIVVFAVWRGSRRRRWRSQPQG